MPVRGWFVVAAFLLAGLALRAESLAGRVLWYDEVYSLWVSEQPAAAILQASALSDPHPPGYYLLLKAWRRIVGPTPPAARLLSLVAWLGSVAVVAYLAAKIFGWPAGAGAACLLSVHAFQVIASTEARMYALLQLAAAVATALLWRAREQDRLGLWAAYGASAAAMAYLSYYSALLLLAHGLWVLATQPGRSWAGPAVAVASAVAAYGPWLPFLPGSVTANTVPWRPPPDAVLVAGLLASQVYGGHWLGAAGYYGSGVLQAWQWLAGLAPVTLLVPGFLALRQRNAQAGFLFTLCWLVPVGAAVAASFLVGKVAAYAYHLTYVQPVAAVAVAAGVAEVWSPRDRSPRCVTQVLAAVGVLVYAASAADGAWRDLRYQPFRYDLAADYLRSLHRKQDMVLYVPQGMRRVMRYYFEPTGREVQLALPLAAWGPKAHQARQRFRDAVAAALRASSQRVWVVASPPSPPWVPEIIEQAAVESGYLPGPVARFGHVTVGLLVRRGR